MRAAIIVMLSLALVHACASDQAPSASPSPSPFSPFPEGVVIEPGPDAPSATVSAASQGGAEIDVDYRYELGHCGFGSPFDFDASLWDPTGVLDRLGGPVDAEQEVGELINATSGVIRLLDGDHAQFLMPSGTVVALTRHEGPKEYSLCD
jgi:hypothetical protein